MARYIDVEPFMDWLVKRAKECKQSKFDYTRIKGGAFDEIIKTISRLPTAEVSINNELEQNVIRPLCNRCAALTQRTMCLYCGRAVRDYCERLSPVFNEGRSDDGGTD